MAAAGLLVSKVESSDSIRETGFKIIISKMSKRFFRVKTLRKSANECNV